MAWLGRVTGQLRSRRRIAGLSTKWCAEGKSSSKARLCIFPRPLSLASRGVDPPEPSLPTMTRATTATAAAAPAIDAPARTVIHQQYAPRQRAVPGAGVVRASRTTWGRSRGPDVKVIRRRPTLPGARAPSTIGPGRLNFSVRNGKRCTPAGMTAEIVEGRRMGAPSKLHSDLGVF